MAYTIRIPTDQDSFKPSQIGKKTVDPIITMHQLVHDIRTATHAAYDVRDFTTYTKTATRKLPEMYVIEMRSIRLHAKDRKDYCGQHAGPCAANARVKKGLWLESADWIRLHNAINVLLDLSFIKAEIFTTRVDQYLVKDMPVNLFYVRTLALGGRKRYDYVNGAPIGAFRDHYLFNPGTANQFGEALSYGPEEEVSEELHVLRRDGKYFVLDEVDLVA